MSWAQLWTWPCNRTQSWKKYLKFEINFQWYKLLKIQYLPHLKSKKYKLPPGNSNHQGVSKNIKQIVPISLKYIVVWFFGIFDKNVQ